MYFPGEILVQHKWIVLVAVLVVALGAFAGANRETYNYYTEHAPDISWQNIPESALTIFLWNMRNALFSLLGIVLAFWSGFGLGQSIGMVCWVTSQNSLGIVSFSHGILEIYSIFLAMVGGLLVMAKIGEAVWGFFGSMLTAHYVDWKEVAEEYCCLAVFSVVGLFVSAWMEALFGFVFDSGGFWIPIAIVNTVSSLMIVSYLSFPTVRVLVARGSLPARTTTTGFQRAKDEEKLELGRVELLECPECGKELSPGFKLCPYCGYELKLPTCPNCGKQISREFNLCPYCGTKLKQKPK